MPDRADLKSLAATWPGEIKPPLTVHRSKGLEADYVIVNGLTADKYGFPSEIEDDPLLDLVLASADSYPNAEERRLFYVALTRARHQVHVIVDRSQPSPFALELMEGDYEVRHVGRGVDVDLACPECKSGVMEERMSGLISCSNYPHCEYVAARCSECDDGILLPKKDSSDGICHCTNESCSNAAPICPKCQIGALVKKSGKYGDFLACHMWPRCDYIDRS